MATEEGIVTAVHPRTAWVKTTQSSACKHCSAKSSCHTENKEMHVEVINLAGAGCGDRVVISFETASLMKATFLLYVFPILCMIAGAVIGQVLAPPSDNGGSLSSAFFAFAFLAIAILFVKVRGNRMARKTAYQPKIIRIIHRKPSPRNGQTSTDSGLTQK